MFPCPKCSHEVATKSGVVKGRQRWKCKYCGYNYTVASRGASNEQKRHALELYLEGLGFRSIGRLLNVSHVSAYNWIREFGEKLDEIKSDTEIKVVEIDEMHNYVGQKKIIVGSGLLLIEVEEDSSIALLASETQGQAKSYENL